MNKKARNSRPPQPPSSNGLTKSLSLICFPVLTICLLVGCADGGTGPKTAAPQSPTAVKSERPPAKRARFSKKDEVWIDLGRREVIVGGAVSLREGMLEMFACPEGTKEHESVVAVKSKAATVHAALLAVGAKPGHPAQFDPVYVPAKGTVVDIDVTWADGDGKTHTARAQDWVMHLPTSKPMSQDWVFGGSSFWRDEATGQDYYQAEGGELICLSNFSTATLDLPVSSSQANSDLLFGAFTENVPALGTPVKLILRPRLKASATPDKAADAKEPGDAKPGTNADERTTRPKP